MNTEKIAVLTEKHWCPTKFTRFNKYFTFHGYAVAYISRRRNQKNIAFGSSPENDKEYRHITITLEVNNVQPNDYSFYDFLSHIESS